MSRYVNPVPQYYLNDGSVASSGKLYFYENKDPNTKKDTFSDEPETIKNTNPVLLDGEGRCPPIFGTGRYTVVLKSNQNIQQWSRDDVDLTSVLGQFADWSAIITYRVNDIVRGSDGNYYSSIVSNNLGNDPISSPTLWEELEFLTVWNTNATYSQDDIVIDEGNFYRSVSDDNTGNKPSASSTTVWADTAQPREWLSTRTYQIGDFVAHSAALWSSAINNNNNSEPGSFGNSDWRDITELGTRVALTGASSVINSGFNNTYHWNDTGGHELTIGVADSDEGATKTIIICDPESPSNITLKRDFAGGVTLKWSFSDVATWTGPSDSYDIKPGETFILISTESEDFYRVYAENGISEIVELGGEFTAGEEIRVSREGSVVTVTSNGVLGHVSDSIVTSAASVIPSLYRPDSPAREIVYGMSSDGVYKALVDSSGTFQLTYIDWTGAAFNRTSSGSVVSLTYDTISQ